MMVFKLGSDRLSSGESKLTSWRPSSARVCQDSLSANHTLYSNALFEFVSNSPFPIQFYPSYTIPMSNTRIQRFIQNLLCTVHYRSADFATTMILSQCPFFIAHCDCSLPIVLSLSRNVQLIFCPSLLLSIYLCFDSKFLSSLQIDFPNL